MSRWLSFTRYGQPGFGILNDDQIEVHEGNIFESPSPPGYSIPAAVVHPILSCQPANLIGLWNNFFAQAAKQNLNIPQEPLCCIKSPSITVSMARLNASPPLMTGEWCARASLVLSSVRCARG